MLADQDEDQDEGPETEDLAPIPTRDALYAMLGQRLQAAPQAAGLLQSAQTNVADSVNRNNLYAALAKSAAQIGTIGGKAADTSAVEEAAKGNIQSAAATAQGSQQQIAQQDSDRDALYKMLAQKSNLEFQGKKLENTMASQKEKERHNKEMEKLGQTKVNVSVSNSADKAALAKTKQDKEDEKEALKLAQDLNPATAKRGSPFGRSAIQEQNADKVLTLIDAFKDPNDLTKQDMRDLATAVAAMTGAGSSTAVTQVNELVPGSAAGDTASIMQYLTNQPKGANQGEFVKKFQHIAEREKGLAKAQIKHAQIQMASGHVGLLSRNKDMFNATLANAGISPQEYAMGSGYLENYLASQKAPAAAPQGGSGTAVAAPAAPAAGGAKTVTRKQINRQTNQTRITYSDGTTETVDGIQ